MKFSALPSWIAPAAIAGGVAMFAAGWSLGGKPGRANVTAESAPAGNGKRADRQARAYGRYQIPHHALMRVRAIRELSDPAEQMRATIALAHSIPLSEIGDWLEGRWFPNSGDYNLSLFNKLLEKRWQDEDPDGLAEWRIKQGGSSGWTVLNDWAQNDPERLLTYFRENPNRERECQFLQHISAKNPDLALARIRELIAAGIPPNTSETHYLGEALKRIAAADPAKAESLLESLPTSFARKLEAGMVENSLKQSFSDGIRTLWDRPDGWVLFADANVENKSDKLLAELADLPDSWKAGLARQPYGFISPDTAGKWLDFDFEAAGFTADQRKSILAPALYYFGRNDPARAVTMMNDLDLNEDQRHSVIINLFHSAKPEQLENVLPLLTSDKEREEASRWLASRTQGNADPDQRPGTPEQWVEAAGKLGESGNTSSPYHLVSALERWDRAKIEELTRSFASMPEETKSRMAAALTQYGNDVDPALRGEAVRHLITADSDDPNNRQGVHQASELAVQWMRNDPDAAAGWVNSLPAGNARVWAQKNLARNWALYDPDAARQWVDSLPSADAAAVRSYLKEKR